MTDCDPILKPFAKRLKTDSAVFVFYFSLECEGLASAGQTLAEFCNMQNFGDIKMIGHSKCAPCLKYGGRYLEKPNQAELISISGAFGGTTIAEQERMKAQMNPFLYKRYQNIFSDHAVDRDIKPGSPFLSHLPSISPFKKHVNIVSKLATWSDCKSPVDVAFFGLDKMLNIRGDGIISLASQTQTECDEEITISASHWTSLIRALQYLQLL